MSRETQPKFRFTLGNAFMWISFFFPLIFVNVRLTGIEIRAVFWAAGALLTLGYGISCWQDYRWKHPFSVGRLLYFGFMAFVYAVMTPVFMSSAYAAGELYKEQPEFMANVKALDMEAEGLAGLVTGY